MRYWNYRILAFEHNKEFYFKVCEVHYENETPISYTENTAAQSENGKKGIRWVLNKQKESLKKPILHGGDKFPQEY